MIFIDNKYTKWYFNIISSARNRVTPGYTENHHIIPTALGGENSKTNLVDLTYTEHLLCHKLLPKMTLGKNKALMEFADQMMHYGNIGMKRNSSKPYKTSRSKEQRELVSQAMKGAATAKDKNGNVSRVSIDDPRWLSGEIMGWSKGTSFSRDNQKGKAIAKLSSSNNIIGLVDKADPRWVSGEIIFHLCGVNGNRARVVHT